MSSTNSSAPRSLPPRPDPQSGEPRPPHAPVYHGREADDARERNERYRPGPPAGEGPVLAWYQAGKTDTVLIYSIGLIIMFLALGVIVWLKGGGFLGWTQYWPMWLVMVIAPLFAALTVRGDRCAAGAEWLRHGKTWVRLYELTQITLRRYAYDMELHLTDRGNRTVEVSTELLQHDRLVWDLTYNGLLHSTVNGAAVTTAAREALHLPANPTAG